MLHNGTCPPPLLSSEITTSDVLGIREQTSANLLLNILLLSKQNPLEPSGHVCAADSGAVHPFPGILLLTFVAQ